MSQYSKYDSEFCGNIPIHIINTIQSYGVLVAIDHELTIQQVSENISEVVAADVKSVVQQPLSNFFGDAFAEQIKSYITDHPSEKITTSWNGHYIIVHFKPEMVLLEIEISGTANEPVTFTNQFRKIQSSIRKIEAAQDIDAVCFIAAQELKQVSGFDKVMIYAFDKDWNGHVLAEAKEPGMEAYLGFTFPASDIPKPARDIYKNNPYRFIPDRDFEPVKLYPVINPISHGFLDMSDCNVRAVAAVHVEYLKNMKVAASMSVRLLNKGELWGLIACHHTTPKSINNELCTTLELLSTIIAARISSLELQSYHDFNSRLNSLYTQVIENIYKQNDLIEGLSEGKPHPLLMDLMQASGMSIFLNKQALHFGEVPNPVQLEDLLLWLQLKDPKRVFHTDSLGSSYENIGDMEALVSGLLIIPIQSQQDEYILLYRKEVIQTTNWGGNPEERIFFDKDPQIYHPRHSFKLWQEHVKGQSLSWQPEEVQTMENLRSFLFEFLSVSPSN
ncbi:GAF domain-containing protein [Chitinophaga arvensicola]|uniref:PAS fold-containing protein n=1 Tax=Chitinophaga arvensicola TaxID=29529 RepID=A0A1I0R9K7_9BACT|nr:GAF domain-containing protein [Chitinophaga arvensicola]SEW36889.1 PAS fold-containing protein [Chitinophaga arvensicola]